MFSYKLFLKTPRGGTTKTLRSLVEHTETSRVTRAVSTTRLGLVARLWSRSGSAGGCLHGFVTALRGFAECFEAFRIGHERGGLAIAQRTAGGKRECDGRGGNVVRHFGDEHGVVLPEGEIRVHDSSIELFDGAAHGVK